MGKKRVPAVVRKELPGLPVELALHFWNHHRAVHIINEAGEYATNINTTFGIVALGSREQAQSYSLTGAAEIISIIHRYGFHRLRVLEAY